jgi:hypothetical protein
MVVDEQKLNLMQTLIFLKMIICAQIHLWVLLVREATRIISLREEMQSYTME